MPTPLEIIAAFIEGRCDALTFESRLQRDADLEELLGVVPAPRHAHAASTLFHHLLALDYRHPGDVLSAQDALTRFLADRNVPVRPSTQAAENYRLLLASQPKWLDADAAFLQRLLADAPPAVATSKQRQAWLRQRLLERFRCVVGRRAGCSRPSGPSVNRVPWSSWGRCRSEITFMTRRRFTCSTTRPRVSAGV